jgi:hypothetical protein
MTTLITYQTSKFDHSNEYVSDWLTAGVYLESGKRVCPFLTAMCAKACLYNSGRADFTPSIPAARQWRTNLLFNEKPEFMRQLRNGLVNHEKKAAKLGRKPAFRLNTTSDIRWDVIGIMEEFPNIQFYDYTKWPYAKRPNESLPANYHLTFSRSELTTDAEIHESISHGRNVAVVFSTKRGQPLPEKYLGYDVIDGDLHDLRFLDPVGVIVGLRFKKNSKAPTADGFVVDVATLECPKPTAQCNARDLIASGHGR